jgi:PAS domain S-box-containing protein
MRDENRTREQLMDELVELRRQIAELEASETELKRMEGALQESEERFQQVAENAQEWIWEVDANGLYTYASPVVERILGYKPEEVVGRKHFYDLFYAGDREETKKAAFEVFSRKQSFRGFINQNTHKNGKIVWLSTSGVPILDGERNLLGYRGADTDVTERMQTEERLQRQGAVLEAINKVFQETLICETEEEVARTCLAVAESLTGSKFGFIGEVNEAGRFDTIALSDPGWHACRIPKSNAVAMVRDMEIRGIWGRAINSGESLIVNDPPAHPDSVGTPEGHPALTAFLGVPLKYADKTFGMIALANKESGYTADDQEAIETLSLSFVEALMRKRRDVRLTEYREQLERKVEERTKELEELNRTLQERVQQAVSELRRRDEAERKRLIAEIDQAREVQMDLFPQSPPQIAGFDIWGVCQPAQEVGGDFFDYLHLGSDKLCLALGDVSGKGMKGAMNAAMAHGMLHAEARVSDSVPAIISELNAVLCSRLDRATFTTLSLAVIDVQSRELQLCNAGNPYPILLRRGQSSLLEISGMPLGIISGIEYDETHLALRPGDILILYSDGITEAIASDDRVYGMDELRRVVGTFQPDLSAQSIVEEVIENIRRFAGDHPQSDDMTVVAMRVKETTG